MEQLPTAPNALTTGVLTEEEKQDEENKEVERDDDEDDDDEEYDFIGLQKRVFRFTTAECDEQDILPWH